MPGEWEAAGRGDSWGFGSIGQEVEGSHTRAARQAQETRHLEEAAIRTRMSPSQRLSYAKQVGIRDTISSIGSLFGAKSNDPELRKANALDAAYKILDPEDAKDPSKAATKVADYLAENGEPALALDFRIKASDFADKRLQNEQAKEQAKMAQIDRRATQVGKSAAAAIEGMRSVEKAPNAEVLKDSVWEAYVRNIEEVAGKEAAEELRAISKDQRSSRLDLDYTRAKTMAQNNASSIADSKTSAANWRLEQQLKTKQITLTIESGLRIKKMNQEREIAEKTLGYKYDALTQKGNIALITDAQKQVENLDSHIKAIENDLVELPTKLHLSGDTSDAAYQKQKTDLETQLALLRKERIEISSIGDNLRASVQSNIEAVGSTGSTGGVVLNYDQELAKMNAAIARDPSREAGLRALFDQHWNADKTPKGASVSTANIKPQLTAAKKPTAKVPVTPAGQDKSIAASLGRVVSGSAAGWFQGTPKGTTIPKEDQVKLARTKVPVEPKAEFKPSKRDLIEDPKSQYNRMSIDNLVNLYERLKKAGNISQAAKVEEVIRDKRKASALI